MWYRALRVNADIRSVRELKKADTQRHASATRIAPAELPGYPAGMNHDAGAESQYKISAI
jgi:hypothetical protein